jgi:hypothetical protein
VAPAASLASVTLPRVWQSVGYRPLGDVARARDLFDFAAVPWPPERDVVLAWGAWIAGDRLCAAVLATRHGASAMFHGPVVRDAEDPLEIATQLVTAALDHATALGVVTVYTRPLGLDRVWVRCGFLPVPESSLPSGLVTPGGPGLYAWRGGSALWTFRAPAGE